MSAQPRDWLNQDTGSTPKDPVQRDKASEFAARADQLGRQYRLNVDETVRGRDADPAGVPATANYDGVTLQLRKRTDASAEVPGESLSAKVEWEGTVTRVGHETFWASLTRIERAAVPSPSATRLHAIFPTEHTELPLDDVRASDRELVRPGAVFRMVVGYQISRSGRRRAIDVVFRRLPRWRPYDMRAAEAEAANEQTIFDQLSQLYGP
jgi:hypothetical protein